MDPSLDARDAQPIWDDALEAIVTLAPHASDAAAECDFWRLAGRKSLQHGLCFVSHVLPWLGDPVKANIPRASPTE